MGNSVEKSWRRTYPNSNDAFRAYGVWFRAIELYGDEVWAKRYRDSRCEKWAPHVDEDGEHIEFGTVPFFELSA